MKNEVNVSSLIGLPFYKHLSLKKNPISELFELEELDADAGKTVQEIQETQKTVLQKKNTLLTKHEEKKQKKNSSLLWIIEPNLVDFVRMYHGKGTLEIPHEAISQILFHSLGYKQVVVQDDHHSLVVAAVAASRGTDNLFRINGPTLEVHTLGALGYTTKISAYSPDMLSKDLPVLFVLAPKDPFVFDLFITLLESASPHQKDFLLFHPCKEGLLDTFNGLMMEKKVSLLDLRECFCREYQTRLGAIHPHMTKESPPGFLLSGTFLNTGFS